MDDLNKAMTGLEQFLDELLHLDSLDPEGLEQLPGRLESLIGEITTQMAKVDQGDFSVWSSRLEQARARLDKARMGLEARRSDVASRLSQETRRTRSLDYQLPQGTARSLNRKA